MKGNDFDQKIRNIETTNSRFHMKTTASATKSLHQDLGPCAVYTY